MKKNGHLIVLEGPDGVGKSFLGALLVEELNRRGAFSELHGFPGNIPGTLGSLVYKLHHDPLSCGIAIIAPSAIQAAHVAAHLDAIQRIFHPAVAAGSTIVLDRYWWSTLVYGAAAGVSRGVLKSLVSAEQKCWDTLIPLVVFLVDRDRPWQEIEDLVAWQAVADEYRSLAERERSRGPVEVVANTSPDIDVIERMVEIVIRYMEAGVDDE